MNAFLNRLIEQRMKLIKGLDANEGDINLDIFEDFYPDQAHFVFELLQNAEDAGATEVTLTLLQDGCRFEHNGTRSFTETDVRAITGIHNSTKNKSQDQIGKFGIGFKSVFVYTLTPEVYSGDFSFRISRLVLPNPIDQDPSLGTKTRFWFPFNNPEKSPQDAFAEIDDALITLAETSLLFLSNIESVSWSVDDTTTGDIVRIQHSVDHFEVLKQIEGQATTGQTTTSAHFLKFDRTVVGLEKQKVAVAFALDLLPDVPKFEPDKPLAEQLKIVPAHRGQVAVFFPAEKEASGLRFHLHAPFVPELSRASIKETPENEPLFLQLADLTAALLHQIRDLGLLTVEFLAVLPNPQDSIPSRYQGIKRAIVQTMNNEPLTPTHAKSHAPAKHLLQAKASLKELLSKDDLEFLVDYDDKPPEWAASAPQRNSNADRFLSGLPIKEWDIESLIKFLLQKASEKTHYNLSPYYAFMGADPDFVSWFANQSLDWIQRFYSVLYVELNPINNWRRIKNLQLARLTDGRHSIGSKCYFPSDGVEGNNFFPRVDIRVYTSGRNKAQQEYAKKFLQEIGVTDVGEAEEVEAILKQRYTADKFDPKKQDLKRFVALVEKEPGKADIFGDYFIFERTDGRWIKPSQAFLDQPFVATGLKAYYEAQGKSANRYAMDESYQTGKVSKKRFVGFAESVGVQTELEVEKGTVSNHPLAHELEADLYKSGVRRTTTGIDEEWHIPNLASAIKAPSVALAKLLSCTLTSAGPRVLRARYRPNQQYETKVAPSSLVLLLHQNAWIPQTWIPQKDGQFVLPEQASQAFLPAGFLFDETYEWLKALQFGENERLRSQEHNQKQKAAKESGFDSLESLERARRFAALPLEEQEKFFAERDRREAVNLPEDEPSNPGRRAHRVGAQAADAPGREAEKRVRSVSVSREAVKQEAEQYLRQRYTNADEEMFCQVCQKPVPFRLDDGNPYFEKVEFLTGLKKRHYQNYLALCPNHAAMFQYANGSTDLLHEMFMDMADCKLEVVLAQRDTVLYFTKTHIVDIRAVIKVDNAVDNLGIEN